MEALSLVELITKIEADWRSDEEKSYLFDQYVVFDQGVWSAEDI